VPASADARGGGVAAADWRDLSWGDTFQQYSLTHLVVVVLCALVIWAVVAAGRRQRRLSNLARDEADGPGRVLGALLTVYWLIYQLWWSFPQRPLARDSWLPLHLCDLAGLVAGLALLTGRRWLTTTLYFWAFAFSTQAFITPIVREGPATARFWMFWESHTAIIGAAVYVVVVRGYRPGARDFRFGILASLAYVAVVLPLNLAFGWNYGYVGPTSPQVPTIVDRLGPWPWRLLPIAGLAVGAMLIVWLPWLVAERFGGRRAGDPARTRRRTAGAPPRGGQ
jgi:hypothetical integral membrane protein (TIGR02206 family)